MKKIKIPFDPTILFRRIKELRGDQTLEEFAEKYGIALSTLKNYETSRVPPFEFLYALHIKEKVSLDWLVHDNPNQIFNEWAAEEKSPYLPSLPKDKQELLHLWDQAKPEVRHAVRAALESRMERKKKGGAKRK